MSGMGNRKVKVVVGALLATVGLVFILHFARRLHEQAHANRSLSDIRTYTKQYEWLHHEALRQRIGSEMNELAAEMDCYYAKKGIYAPWNYKEGDSPYLYYHPGRKTDPYSPMAWPYMYFSAPGNGSRKSYFVLWSCGPDRKHDLTLDLLQQHASALTTTSAIYVQCAYDPTNGIESRGDIIRIGIESE